MFSSDIFSKSVNKMFIAFPIWLEGLIRSVTDMDGIQVKKVERKEGESDFNFEQKKKNSRSIYTSLIMMLRQRCNDVAVKFSWFHKEI